MAEQNATMKLAARVVYAALAVLVGLVALLALIKPSLVLSTESYSPFTAHLVQEQAAGGVFVGLMALWCLFHFDQRRHVHCALLVYFALFAGIHWVEYAAGRRHIASPLLNSLPLLALLAITPALRASRR
jgi:hypothetical protein